MHRTHRQTKGFKIMCIGLCILLLGVYIGFIITNIKLSNIKSDVRYTRDAIWMMDSKRHDVLKSNDIEFILNDLNYLYLSLKYTDNTGPLSDIVRWRREDIIEEYIIHLQELTDYDYGDDPERWLKLLDSLAPVKSSRSQEP